jgi:nucleoside-diphosphate-sugar epimerase
MDTGASGFVGRALCDELTARGHVVHAVVRTPNSIPGESLAGGAANIRWVALGNLDSRTNWHDVLCDFARDHPGQPHAIIHCAARVHVKGNLLKLLGLLANGLPLPFASTKNRRAMVDIDNLVDLLIYYTQRPKAVSETHLVCDDDDLSTPAVLRSLGVYMNRKPLLIKVPVSILKLLGRVSGQQALVARLTDSLQVDCSSTRQTLGWKPPVKTQIDLNRMVDWYLSYNQNKTSS